MKRAIGIILAVVAIVIGLLGFASRASGYECLIAVVLMIVGALLFASAQRADRAAVEAQRHEEMLEAVRNAKK